MDNENNKKNAAPEQREEIKQDSPKSPPKQAKRGKKKTQKTATQVEAQEITATVKEGKTAAPEQTEETKQDIPESPPKQTKRGKKKTQKTATQVEAQESAATAQKGKTVTQDEIVEAQDDVADAPVEVSDSTPSTPEQPSPSELDLLNTINQRLDFLETFVRESTERSDPTNAIIVDRLESIKNQIKMTEKSLSDLSTLLDVGFGSVENKSEELLVETKHMESGLAALKKLINTAPKQLGEKIDAIPGKTFERLNKVYDQRIKNIKDDLDTVKNRISSLDDKIIDKIAETINPASKKSIDNLIVLNKEIEKQIDGVKKEIEAHLKNIRDHITRSEQVFHPLLTETKLDVQHIKKELQSFFEQNVNTTDLFHEIIEVLLKRTELAESSQKKLNVMTTAKEEADEKLVKDLQKFWGKIQKIESSLRRGMSRNSNLQLIRKDILHSHIKIFSDIGCHVELGEEAVELKQVSYDGSNHLWDKSDGEEIAKSGEEATVLLPGWRLGNHWEKPLLGRFVEDKD